LAYNGLYAANDSWNITVVDGNSYVGRYAADGSLNVVVSSGGSYIGKWHSSGAMNVTVSPGTLVPQEAPDGSVYVSTTGNINSGQYVTVVSGSLTPGGSGQFLYYIFV
jgi:hypothetical protein